MALAMNSRRITLIVAIVAAALAGIFTVRYLTGVQRPTDPAYVATQRYVLVAGRSIRAHEKITADMLTKVSRPEGSVEPDALAEPREAIGTVALIAIPRGDALTRSKVGVPAELGITAKLRNGMRAVSIPVDFIKSVSSLVSPGDRVDVLATSTRGRSHPTRTVIRGAVVLAVNTALEATDPSASPAPAAPTGPVSVTLGVTPDQANLLTYADINTTLRLALRPPKEPIRAFPVQPIDVGSEDAPAASNDRSEGSHNVPPPPNPVAAPVLNVPAPAVPAPAPMPVPLPVAAVAAPAAPAKASILVIEGDTVVAGQR